MRPAAGLWLADSQLRPAEWAWLRRPRRRSRPAGRHPSSSPGRIPKTMLPSRLRLQRVGAALPPSPLRPGRCGCRNVIFAPSVVATFACYRPGRRPGGRNVIFAPSAVATCKDALACHAVACRNVIFAPSAVATPPTERGPLRAEMGRLRKGSFGARDEAYRTLLLSRRFGSS